MSETLSGEQADLDLRLIQPTAVFRCVMELQPVPKVSTLLLPKTRSEGLALVRAQIVHYQVDAARKWVSTNNLFDRLSELGSGAVGRHTDEVAPALGFDGTEYVGCPAALVLVIALGDFARGGCYDWPNIGVQSDGFFIQTKHWFGRFVRLFINAQNVFHLADVVGVEFRDAPHFFPATA